MIHSSIIFLAFFRFIRCWAGDRCWYQVSGTVQCWWASTVPWLDVQGGSGADDEEGHAWVCRAGVLVLWG